MLNHSFSVPHIVYELGLPSGKLSVLIALFKLSDEWSADSKANKKWFFITNENLCRLLKQSPSTVKRAKYCLKRLGLIDYQVGSWIRHRATKYRILTEHFQQLAPLKGSNVTHTKARTITKTKVITKSKASS